MQRTGEPHDGPSQSPSSPQPASQPVVAPSDTANDDKRRRQDALSALAAGTDIPAADQKARPRMANAFPVGVASRRRLAVFSLLLVVAIVAAGTLFLLARSRSTAPRTTTHTGPLTVDLTARQFGCPTNAAWSPDGRSLAVLAHAGSCNSTNMALVVLDVADGHEVSALPIGAVGEGLPLAWTPDGTSVAYQTYVVAAGGDVESELVLWTPGGKSRTIQGSPVPLSPAGYFVWDLRQGALAHATDQDLPPALTYRWTSDGSIVPDAAIVPAGPSADYTGSPTAAPSAATFSRWQPGAIVPIEPLGAHFDQPPTAMTYQSNTAVWSSDGRYLALGLSLRAVLHAASGGPAPSFGDGFCRAPYNRALCAAGPVAYPDAAFAAIR